ncbi:MAG: PD-(D/E)XK nuclease family protein [Alphaproteobacteria bacterium]|nr:PD-(D/E)XK nuclease family protein [Alphaproteobacteria bacterium]
MGLNNNNIFYATNPARMLDALWYIISECNSDIADMLIFLPSRRAVRCVEKMIAEKSGGTAILPKLVALGEGLDDDDTDNEITDHNNIISKTERVAILAKLLSADANVGNLTTALPIAHDLVRMQDYLENEGINPKDINWIELVDEKYATHFQNKAKILNILSNFMDVYANGRQTSTQVRNNDIRAWINVLDKYKLVVVCGSTGSVPATADLMIEIAKREHGRILLSGKICGRIQDFMLDTNPYNAEYKLLGRIGVSPDEITPIDVGESVIDFMNYAFGNDCDKQNDINTDLTNCNLVVAPRESVEAKIVAQIAKQAIKDNKSVLVITPDAAGNQRIAQELSANDIDADFSSGTPGTMTDAGRAILNILDNWIENNSNKFDKIYTQFNHNVFDTIAQIIDEYSDSLTPPVQIDNADSTQVWCAIKELSDILQNIGMNLTLSDTRAFVADCLSAVSVRPQINDNASVVVLGTIESRMQTADIVIMTGLNDGMFPARGYENNWIPKSIAQSIGLPSPDRKVSLQALDFINLSCGTQVYWIRTAVAGGVQTTESRFISRVVARRAEFNINTDLLQTITNQDNVPEQRLDYSAPLPPPDWSDVYVTELEMLIHNPYAFYVRHILKLRVMDDYWTLPDARHFGNLVHSVIENTTDFNAINLVSQMDTKAREILGADSIVYHFWHKRFVEIAPVLVDVFANKTNHFAEIAGHIKIAGRNVRARADRIWDGGVLDIKTGTAPSKKQLMDGNMPQLPLEALMLQSGGFKIRTTQKSEFPIMQFLQLKNNDVRLIEYDANTTNDMIRAARDKVTELFNIYSAGGASYEYHETNDQKYKIYDDLARVND